jgi:hypothetical protein
MSCSSFIYLLSRHLPSSVSLLFSLATFISSFHSTHSSPSISFKFLFLITLLILLLLLLLLLLNTLRGLSPRENCTDRAAAACHFPEALWPCSPLRPGIFLGVKCGRCIRLTSPLSVSRLSRKCGGLDVSQTYGSPRPFTRPSDARQRNSSWPLTRELQITYGLYFVCWKHSLSVGGSATDDHSGAYCVLNHAVWTSLSTDASYRPCVSSLCLRYTNLTLKVTHWSHWTGDIDIIPLNGHQTVVCLPHF